MVIRTISASALLILATTAINAQKITYPDIEQSDVVEDYFGTQVSDPYRWLEDENSEATKNFVEQQREVTNAYLSEIPFREKLKNQLTDLWDYETMGAPSKHGNYYVLSRNDGKQNQAITYIKNGKDGKEEVFIDPNTFSSDGTTSISNLSFSKDNKYAAYMLSKSGSDWKEIVVLEVATKKYLTDTVRWSKFSGIAWYKNGFYYSGYAMPEEGKEFSNTNEFHTVFYHELEKPQKEDKIIYKDEKNPLKSHYCGITEDGRFLAISGSKGTSGNNLLVKDLSQKDSEFITLIDGFDNDSYLIDNIEDKLLVFTNYKAPNNRVAVTTLENPLSENWADFIPEKEYVLENISIAGDKLFATYLKDVQSKIEIYKMDGTYIKDLSLPGIGICYGVSGKKGEDEAYYSFTSFITPTSTYQLSVKDLKSSLYFKPKTNFNSDDFVTEQVFNQDEDGTTIPMFISYKKGLKKDGTNPTLLYGYGGFNISYKPSFDVAKSVFMMNGGVYAVVNLRGGGEYGEKWHKAGMLSNKQNVFTDFINAAEYLKKEKYTSTEKLAIHGRSNGGLLVGAVMTQQPNIAKVALPMVGVLDMLRYHKFTIGWAWSVEYGNSEDSHSFENLYAYSPLHNVKPANYPATLILTADHDDRVVPAHSFKFAAELQKQQTGDNPTLIRIDTKSGHGSGKPKSKLIEEWADIWAFTFYNLGVNLK